MYKWSGIAVYAYYIMVSSFSIFCEILHCILSIDASRGGYVLAFPSRSYIFFRYEVMLSAFSILHFSSLLILNGRFFEYCTVCCSRIIQGVKGIRMLLYISSYTFPSVESCFPFSILFFKRYFGILHDFSDSSNSLKRWMCRFFFSIPSVIIIS